MEKGSEIDKSFLDKLRSRDPQVHNMLKSIFIIVSSSDSLAPDTPITGHLAYYYDITLRHLGALDTEFLPTISQIQSACNLLMAAISAREALIALKKWLRKSKNWLDSSKEVWMKLYALKTHIYALYLRAIVLDECDGEVGCLLRTLPSMTLVPSSACNRRDSPSRDSPLYLSKTSILESISEYLEQVEVRSAVKVELKTEGYWWGGKFYDVVPYGVSEIPSAENQRIRLSLLFEMVHIVWIVKNLPSGKDDISAPCLPVCDPDFDGGIHDPLTELPRHVLERQAIRSRVDCSHKSVGGQLRPRQCAVFEWTGDAQGISGVGLGMLIAMQLSIKNQNTVRFSQYLVLLQDLVDSVILHSAKLNNPIHWIDLSANELNPCHLEKLHTLSQVPYVDLSNNSLNDDIFPIIDNMLLKNITIFANIANNSLTEKSIISIANKLKNSEYAKNLKCLDFSNNLILDAIRIMDIFAQALHGRCTGGSYSPNYDTSDDMSSDSLADSQPASVRRYANKLAVRWRAERQAEISDHSIVTHAVSVRSLATHVQESLQDARTSLRETRGNTLLVAQVAPRVVRLEKVHQKLKSHPFIKMFEEEEKFNKIQLLASKPQTQTANKSWNLLKKFPGADSSSASISNIVSTLLSKK